MGGGNRLAHVLAHWEPGVVGQGVQYNNCLDIIVVRTSEEMYEHLESI